MITATFHQVFSRDAHSRPPALQAKHSLIAGAVRAINQTVTHHELTYSPFFMGTGVPRVPKTINYVFSKTSAAPQWKATVLTTRTRSYVSGFPFRSCDWLQHTLCNCDQSSLMEREPKENLSLDRQWGSDPQEIQINHTLQGSNFASTRQQDGSLNNLDIQSHIYNIYFIIISRLSSFSQQQ